MTLEQLVKQFPVCTGQAENSWKENKDCSFVSIFVVVMQKAHNSTLGYGRVSVNVLGGTTKGDWKWLLYKILLNVIWCLSRILWNILRSGTLLPMLDTSHVEMCMLCKVKWMTLLKTLISATIIPFQSPWPLINQVIYDWIKNAYSYTFSLITKFTLDG